ncbi:MAG: hypothetical protein Q8O64_05810 [Sideroxyarcus sp.]|nr:hypothetical protein [Sideroxyarcus sp.]
MALIISDARTEANKRAIPQIPPKGKNVVSGIVERVEFLTKDELRENPARMVRFMTKDKQMSLARIGDEKTNYRDEDILRRAEATSARRMNFTNLQNLTQLANNIDGCVSILMSDGDERYDILINRAQAPCVLQMIQSIINKDLINKPISFEFDMPEGHPVASLSKLEMTVGGETFKPELMASIPAPLALIIKGAELVGYASEYEIQKLPDLRGLARHGHGEIKLSNGMLLQKLSLPIDSDRHKYVDALCASINSKSKAPDMTPCGMGIEFTDEATMSSGELQDLGNFVRAELVAVSAHVKEKAIGKAIGRAVEIKEKIISMLSPGADSARCSKGLLHSHPQNKVASCAAKIREYEQGGFVAKFSIGKEQHHENLKNFAESLSTVLENVNSEMAMPRATAPDSPQVIECQDMIDRLKSASGMSEIDSIIAPFTPAPEEVPEEEMTMRM